jgi:monoamine oxidase
MSESHEITRRGLLGTAAAGAAVAAVPAAEARAKKAAARKVDVVIVGAGLAGLSAARTLVRKGHTVAVLEARDRVGGRTLNAQLGQGKVVEIGGQWIGPTQDRRNAVSKELGIKQFPTYQTGKNLYYRDGVKSLYTGTIPPAKTGLIDVANSLQKLNDMAATVPVSAPWKAPRAAEWDSQTFETWKLANNTTAEGRDLLDLTIEAIWAAEPRDVSLLHVLFYIASARNEKTKPDLNRLINTTGGAQERRFVGGSQLVSIKLAARLGRRIHLNSPVRRIGRSKSGVTVVADSGTWHAKHVIVTGPPALSAQIRHEPQLPIKRAQLTQRFPQGSAIKCIAVYPTPFWRKDGLTGMATSDAGPIKLTYDNSPPDGSLGVLLGFMEGTAARDFGSRSPAARRAGALKSFARYFGSQALKPTKYFDQNWGAEEWTRGCYVGYTPPGVLLDYGTAIRASVGRLHWAGAEYATLWNGYMDGAIRSGEATAADVAKRL